MSQVSRATLEKIIEAVGEGQYLRTLLDTHGVSAYVFWVSLREHPGLMERYDDARKARTEIQVEEMLSISDEEQDLMRAKLQIDTRRWIASKMNPSRYGDRIDVHTTHTLDISDRLLAARRRVADALDVTPTQVLESTPNTSGLQPACASDTPENSSDDIFS